MPKYYTMSKIRKKKRVGLYAKSSRPFALEYSTSTISKAINLVYGMPEFPKNPRAWDVPGTTHFNIFHRSGVSNGNDVLGQVTSDEFRNHPNNHGADDSGASSTMGVDPDDIFQAVRAGQELDTEPANVHVVQDALPVTVVNLDKGKAPVVDAGNWHVRRLASALEQIYGRDDGASTSGVNDSDSDNVSKEPWDYPGRDWQSWDFWRSMHPNRKGGNREEPIGNDGNRESQNIRDVIDDVNANVDRSTTIFYYDSVNSQMHMNQAMTPRPQGEMPAGPSSAAGAVDDAVLDAYNEAVGILLPSNANELMTGAAEGGWRASNTLPRTPELPRLQRYDLRATAARVARGFVLDQLKHMKR